MKWNVLDKVGFLLLVVGGLNWGLVGFFKYNLVDKIFGVDSGLARVVYALVGLAAVWGVWSIVMMMSKKDMA
ncbi:MAG TPA: DUF378 domain-containing protein [Candidatus Saccharimonadales bacterium]|nr:DUF378 domain-containing protein [Candidatus Saccharimonadales bacterium]